jgi:hypothetical protein
MRKEAAENPESYAAREVAKHDARKTRPKVCGYCGTEGHTRAGCDTKKQHRSTFIEDASLWRQALAKWMKDIGLGLGALVRCNDASYYRGGQYMHPNEEDYIPPVGLITTPVAHASRADCGVNHYSGIMGAPEWSSCGSMLSYEFIGGESSELSYRKIVGITLPNIPGIVPRFGPAWYGREKTDRSSRLSNVDWEVVSRSPAVFNNEAFVSAKALKKAAKEWFAAGNDQDKDTFRTFKDFQRKQLCDYVNDKIQLSEMKDPEVPGIDT